MTIGKNLIKRNGDPVKSYVDFWNWFNNNEKAFFKVVKTNRNVEKKFIDILTPKLNELNYGIDFLTGMCDENTVELIFTVDGIIKNLVFVEELLKSAPEIKGWKFTGFKSVKDLSIGMAGYEFTTANLYFYSNTNVDFPDEIDLTFVHDDLIEDNKHKIINGIYTFLHNYLGELEFAQSIDNIKFISKEDAEEELITIEKLEDFLKWRQKEFIERYDGVRHNTENDAYSVIESQLENGKPLVAIINTELLHWNSKASHPWILTIEMHFEGGINGMPDEKTLKLLNKVEDQIKEELKDFEGYLNIGRQTGDKVREIYFACKDFRKPSKVLYKIQGDYSDRLEIHFEIYKDKYWQSFNRFRFNLS